MGKATQRRQSILENLMRGLSVYRRNKPDSAGIVVKALINQRRRNSRAYRNTFGSSRHGRCQELFHASLYFVRSQNAQQRPSLYGERLVVPSEAGQSAYV